MAAPTFPALLLSAVLLLLLPPPPGAEAVWLELPPSGTKCVSEEIQPNVVVLADYAIMYESHPTSHPTVAVKVRARSLPLLLPEEPNGRFRRVGSRVRSRSGPVNWDLRVGELGRSRAADVLGCAKFSCEIKSWNYISNCQQTLDFCESKLALMRDGRRVGNWTYSSVETFFKA